MKRLATALCFVLSVSTLTWGQRAYCEGGGYYCSYSPEKDWVCDPKADKEPGEEFWHKIRSGDLDGATVNFTLCSSKVPGVLAHRKEMRLINHKTGTLELTSLRGGKVKISIGEDSEKK